MSDNEGRNDAVLLREEAEARYKESEVYKLRDLCRRMVEAFKKADRFGVFDGVKGHCIFCGARGYHLEDCIRDALITEAEKMLEVEK